MTTSARKLAKFFIIQLALFCSFIFFSPVINAITIAEDSFEDYSVGNISGNNSGAGWSGAWSTGSSSNQARVIDTSSSPLSYTDSNGQTISGGDRAIEITKNNNEVARRSLSETYDDTIVYASMLIQFTGTQNSNDFLANWLQSSTSNYPNFGIKMNLGPGNSDFFTRTKLRKEVYSTNLVNGQTYFLVMKVWKTGSTSSHYNRAELWVNPTTLDTEPSASTSESNSASSLRNFSTIGFRAVNLDSNDSIIVDRLRYGTTWDDVIQFETTPAPVLHLQADESSWNGTVGEVRDSSGNDNNGTSFNGAFTDNTSSAITGDPGTCGYGVFDGTNDYLEIPHSNDLNGTDALTYMAWVNASNWSGIRQIMAKSVHGGGSGRAQMGIFSERGVLKGRAETENGRREVSASLPSTGDWHHIALVYSDTSLELFIDGVSAASTTFSSRLLKTTTDPLNISKRVGTNQYFFDGLIDEVQVFTQALSQSQIQALMAETHACASPPPTACTAGNVRDNFSTASYSNNDGSKDWTNSWQEIGESDGVSRGKVRVNNSLCTSGNCLRLGTPSGGSASTYSNRGIVREVDLSNSSSATLSFEYRVGVSRGSSTVTLSISNNGGSSWTDLKTFSIRRTNFRATQESFDISAYTAENTQIRFLIDGNREVTGMYIDNINIENTCSSSIDHFELSYSASGLACVPSAVTLKACDNADCSSLYTDSVEVTLSPSGWSTNPVTLTTGEDSTLTLQATTSGNTTLAIADSTVAPANALICYADGVLDPNCTINFAAAGFIFDVPAQTACKTSNDVTLRAVQLDQQSNQCVGALTGSQSVNFFSSYSSPISGTQNVNVSGTSVDTASPGTAVSLNFNADGEATFTVQYDDAGEVQLDATFDNGSGLTLSGNDTFVSKPAALYIYSSDDDASCNSGNASCSRFKKAGEDFNLSVKAACWETDLDNDYSNNAVTPNFELDNITVSSNLVAPSGGSNANLDTSSFNFATSDAGTHTMTQAVSEVGVFTFTVIPPEYFGESITVETSDNIGRFYPDHFAVTSQDDGAFGQHSCGNFTYSGQAFGYQTAPELTVSAYSVDDQITQNYTGSFAKISASDFTVTTPTTDANQLGADSTNLVGLTWSPTAATFTDNGDGSHTFSFGNDTYQYLHVSNSQVAPFTNSVNLTFTDISDSDGIQTDSLPITLNPSGESIRFGRAAIASMHGSELAPLPITLSIEYFDGINWQTNTADQCTVVTLSNHLRLRNTSTSSNAWQSGSTTMTLDQNTTAATMASFANGATTITFSAPGEDNQGYVDLQTNINATHSWLLGDYDNDGNFDDEAEGKASFGIFKGSDRIIFRREVY